MAARPRLILHIGAGKTGSSAIQAFLARNGQQLARNGLIVPGDDLTLKPGHGQQVGFFQSLASLSDAHVQLVKARLDALHRHALRRGASTLIVSGENLLNNGDNPADFTRLFVPVRDLFDIVVVAYIRRQDDFLAAAWAQWYMKLAPDFRSWLPTKAGKIAVWNEAIRPWEKEFPDATIIVRVYDRTRLVGGDVVIDFMDAIGLQPGDYPYVPGPIINPTLNEIATRVAHRNRHLFNGMHDLRFTDFLKTFGGAPAREPVNTGLYLNADERRALLDSYAESNELLRKRLLPRLPVGGLFPMDIAEAPIIAASEQLERELNLLWNVVFETHRRGPTNIARRLVQEVSAKIRRSVGRNQ